jgi:predicted nuclease of predicted toxin-antitoxin system
LAALLKFYLDECIPEQLGKALAQVDYPITIPEAVGKKGELDPDLLPWLAENGYVWVTKDSAAKRRHRDLIIKGDITVVWVRGLEHEGPTGSVYEHTINTQQTFILLATLIPDVAKLLPKTHGRTDHILFYPRNKKWPRHLQVPRYLEELSRSERYR